MCVPFIPNGYDFLKRGQKEIEKQGGKLFEKIFVLMGIIIVWLLNFDEQNSNKLLTLGNF